jgi:hypothetical protein
MRSYALAGEVCLRLGESGDPLAAALAGCLLVVGNGLERPLVRLQGGLTAGLDPFQDLLVEIADTLGRRVRRACGSFPCLVGHVRPSRAGDRDAPDHALGYAS